MPGVSRNTSCAWGRFLTPKMRWRVVCGLGVTMASFIPMMALSNVDLPTLGAPMIVTTPACNDAVSIGAIIPKQRDDTTHLEATAPQDIPRAHRTTCGLSGASRGARESEPMALPAAPRFRGRRRRHPLRRGLRAGLLRCLAICLCHVQAPERTFRIILCQQFSGLFQRRSSTVERALRRREIRALGPYKAHAAQRLAGAINTRRRRPQMRLSLGHQLRPHLALGRVLTRLRHHGIDFFALLKSLRYPLSSFLVLALLGQLFGFVQSVLSVSNATINGCQGTRTHPNICCRSHCPLRAGRTLFQGRQTLADLCRWLWWLRWLQCLFRCTPQQQHACRQAGAHNTPQISPAQTCRQH